MKRFFLLLMVCTACCLTTTTAQTLFSYGPYQVSKAEFLAAFKKNNTGPVTPKAYADYLELYLRYKLKVQAARTMRLDTLPTQKKDLEDFRSQIINSYLADDSTMNLLVKEALAHAAKDRRVSHIYIPYTANDSIAARERIRQAYHNLKLGWEFGAVAKDYSADTAANLRQGDIGWIAAFTLPYALEKLAYETPVQGYSQPYRSSQAYHIFKITAERPATGMMQVAQILLNLPAGEDAQQASRVRGLADSLYNALQHGANFGTLAMQFSDDNASFNNQGVLQPIQPGTYDPDFEDQVYALQQDGELSKPFRTSQGFHILKRMGRFPSMSNPDDANAVAAIKSRVLNDDRSKLAIEAVAQKAKKAVGFKPGTISKSAINDFTAAFFQGDPNGKAALMANTVLATYAGQQLTIKDYGDFLATHADQISYQQPPLTNDQIYAQFIQQKILEEYQQHLERYNPAFQHQLQEFQDGNMIFEAMQVNIWDKAVNDEAGLRRYFEAHKNQYHWKPSVRAIVFNSMDSAAAQHLYTALKADPRQWKQLTDRSNGLVQADSSRFELDQLPKHTEPNLQPGMITQPQLRSEDLITNFIYVLEVLPGDSPRTYDEAKGLVLNDYQNLLEETWIKSLRKKYPVKINKPVLDSLNR